MIELVTVIFGSMGTFLGSTAFRWLGGELFAMWKTHMDRKDELARLRLEHDQERDRRAWKKEEMELAASLQLKTIEVETAANLSNLLGQGILNTVDTINKLTGIKWVDNVNHGVRPVLAIVSILALVLDALGVIPPLKGHTLGDVAQAVLGLYVGGRITATGR